MAKKIRLFSLKNLNPARVVVLGFVGIILLGAMVLWLPISSRTGEFTSPLVCLFTATSATCVTGLVQVDTYTHWTFFGQAVILFLIQMGGLGFVTIVSFASIVLKQRIGLSQRMVIASALNLNGTAGALRVVKRALKGTFFIEGVGALALATRFVPEYGVLKGAWFSLFHSISAFCNGGFDLMGEKAEGSLISYASDPVVLITAMLLTVVGGLGFVVWEDVVSCGFNYRKLSLYSRLVFRITGGLLILGWVFFAITEWDNPHTLGGLSAWDRVLNALFQSVTLRTAGFASFDQSLIEDSTAVASLLFMLIGGSSGSTAGGLKTVTVGVLMLALRAGLKGRDEVVIRERTISRNSVMSAMILMQVMLVLFFIGTLALTFTDDLPFLPSAFEVASALATVGLSMNLTPQLNPLGSLVIIALMFLGRVGILSFSIAFATKTYQLNKVRYPVVDIMVG